MEKQAKKDIPYKFVCSKCDCVEFGGPTAIIVRMLNEKTGKVTEKRIPRRCRMCGNNMIKMNEKRVTKRWLQKKV